MDRASDMTIWIGWAAAALVVLGVATAAASQLASKDAPLRRWLAAYVALLDRDTTFLRLSFDGRRILKVQVGVSVLLVVWAVLEGSIAPLFFVPVQGIVPLAILRRGRERRVMALQDQLDGWLMVLANALRATPAIGQALESTARLMSAPLSEELDLILKETHLGTPLDEALGNASERIGSRSVSSALAVLLIARRTGGDLSAILERSAEQLREMARLEGVVRTKTAETKTQGYVLGVMPFAMVGIMHLMDPTWFVPLTTGLVGWCVVAIAVALWLVAVFSARKILAVDI